MIINRNVLPVRTTAWKGICVLMVLLATLQVNKSNAQTSGVAAGKKSGKTAMTVSEYQKRVLFKLKQRMPWQFFPEYSKTFSRLSDRINKIGKESKVSNKRVTAWADYYSKHVQYLDEMMEHRRVMNDKLHHQTKSKNSDGISLQEARAQYKALLKKFEDLVTSPPGNAPSFQRRKGGILQVKR